jgi:hypothetical protein
MPGGTVYILDTGAVFGFFYVDFFFKYREFKLLYRESGSVSKYRDFLKSRRDITCMPMT